MELVYWKTLKLHFWTAQMTTSGDRMEAGIHRMSTIIDVEAGDTILYLNQDIYNSYTLFRETDEYKQLLTASKFKLAMLASFCFFFN